MSIDETWNRASATVLAEVTPVSHIYIKDIVPLYLKNGVFAAAVSMEISKNMIEMRYKRTIERILSSQTGENISLEITVIENDDEIRRIKLDAALEESGETEEEDEEYDENLISNIINPKFTFENYVIGSSNEYATAAAMATAEKPGVKYNPLFLYGNSGLGKTHLMCAIGNRILRDHPNKRVIYVTSEQFTNGFITALREKTVDQYRKHYRTADVLLIDDVQFIANKEATQEEFFHTFNDLQNRNKQIVLTSDRMPQDLVTLEDRLRTRFGQGLTIDISAPNYETRIAILQKKALLQNANVSEEVFAYIAENIKSNIRELEGALLSVISFSDMGTKPITMDVAKKALKSIISEKRNIRLNAPKIIERVSFYYNITIDEMIGKQRTKNLTLPRQVAMYLCKKMTDMSFVAIAKEFGNRDRTTVMHNVEKIEADLKTNDSLKTDLNFIMKDLNSMNK